MKRIAIHSVPRSGSTWLGEIINSCPNVSYKYQPLFSYAFKGKLKHNSGYNEIVQFFNQIALSDDDFINQDDARREGKLPLFRKEIKEPFPEAVAYKEVRYHYILDNMLSVDKEIKVIGLVRNPIAVINSWLKAPKEFRKDLGWIEKEEWRYAEKKNLDKREEYNGFEKWKEVALMFLELEKKYPQNFMLVKYDDLLQNTGETVSLMFKFCELQITDSTIEFIENKMSNKDAYSVYKQKTTDDAWRESLDTEIANEIINDLKGTSLERYI